jgi:hypothetical protein
MVEEETRRYRPTKNYLEHLPPLNLTAFEVMYQVTRFVLFTVVYFTLGENDTSLVLFTDRTDAKRIREAATATPDGHFEYEEIRVTSAARG